LPAFDIGYKADMQVALDYLGLSASGNPPTKMAVLSARRDSLKMERRTILEGRVPNVQGMGLKDALYVLENAGLKVEARGVGRVTLQSLRPGTPCNKQTIAITLK
jgi:cell division protein FtsI (penicillin-binding protein 3)